MGLSSNILWHQTNKDALKKILKAKSFRYSYSLEYIKYGNDALELAFPMLSLCDIPIADFADYLTKYGGSSIGLSREWGIKNGITPVIYCEKTSPLLDDIISMILRNTNEEADHFFLKFLSHVKNHEGELPKYNYKKYRFYDEHEMRIIPKLEELQMLNLQPTLFKKEYEGYKEQNKKLSLLPYLNVPFNYNDIRYIILKDDKSIEEIKHILSKEIDLSKTKISFFTTSQIEEDFIGISHNKRAIEDKEIKLSQKIDVDKRRIVNC